MYVKNKNFESLGIVAGAILGVAAVGIALYFTESLLSALLGPAGIVLGDLAGRAIERI